MSTSRIPRRFQLVFAVLAACVAGACIAPEQPGPPSPPTIVVKTPGAAVPNIARDGYPGSFPYTMQPGDTLFSIAQRFQTSVDALIDLNRIDDVTEIPIGATLFIPLVTPTPIATSTPTPGAASVRVDHGPRDSGRVGLTFDMGGRVEPALDIMNWLLDARVPATIFITGAVVDSPTTDAGRQVLTIIDANRDLFELGNHSYSHPDFTILSVEQMRDELTQTEDAVGAQLPLRLQPLFRPPFGAVSASVLAAIGAAGYGYTIMWDGHDRLEA